MPDSQQGQTLDPIRRAQCEGWMTSAQNAVHLVCPMPADVYRKKTDALTSKDWGYMSHEGAAALSSVLVNLLRDVDAGCLGSIVDKARAEAFNDFLDHAQAYLDTGRKNESGSIAGIVFEDSLRRVCGKHQIAQKDVKVDLLITALTNSGVISQTKAKRARAAAHVRTKATHAQWDEFDISDVQATIEFIREFNDHHLAT